MGSPPFKIFFPRGKISTFGDKIFPPSFYRKNNNTGGAKKRGCPWARKIFPRRGDIFINTRGGTNKGDVLKKSTTKESGYNIGGRKG